MARKKTLKIEDKESAEVAEALKLKNQLVRALADYDNLKKRVEAEKEVWIRFSGERILTKMITLLDILESAQEHLGDQGLAIALSEFRKILDEEGLEEIRPKGGDNFDENLHEAVEVVEAKNPRQSQKGKIAETALSGWKFKDGPVIRVAKVKVERSEIPGENEG